MGLLVGTAMLLAGCGQKGDLVLPASSLISAAPQAR